MKAHEILVVDDDPDVLAFLATALTDEGYRTRRAEDGLAAIEEVRRVRPDLVVADGVMPRLDGVGLARSLLLLPDPVPIVLISGAPSVSPEEGMPFIPKPLDIDQLFAVTARALERPPDVMQGTRRAGRGPRG